MSILAKPPIPILRSFDESATRAFYLDFLGFEVEFEHRFDPDAPLYLGVYLDACVLHLSEHYGDAVPGAGLRIEVNDVVEYASQLRKKRYKFARPGVQRQSMGWDEMTVKDPSGNRLVFWTPNHLT